MSRAAAQSGDAFTSKVSAAFAAIPGRAGAALSGVAGRFGAAASKAGSAFSTSVSGMFTRVKASADKSAAAIGDVLSARLGKGAGKAGQEITGKIGGALSGIVKKAGVISGVGGIFAGLMMGVERTRQVQDVTVAFETMLGSAQKAGDYMKELLAFAKQTPFSFPGIARGAQQLTAMGIETSKVIPLMRTLGDTAGGLGAGEQGLTTLVDIFGKLKAGSKLYLEDINRLVSMGVPALEILAKGMGKTVQQVRDDISAGAVSADQAIDLLAKGMDQRFSGMMAKQKKTLTGTLDTFRSAVSAFFSEQVIMPALPVLTQVLTGVADAFKVIGPLAGGVVKGAFTALGVALAPVKLGFDLLLRILRPFSGVLETIGTVVGAFAATFGGAIGGVLLFSAAIAKVQKAIVAFKFAWLLLNAAFTASPIGMVVAGLVALGVVVFLAYKKFAPFRNLVDSIGRVIRAGLVPAFNLFKGALSAVLDWTRANWPLLLAILTGPLGLFVFAVIRFKAQILGFFSALWSGLLAGAVAGMRAVTGYLSGVFAPVTAAWRAAWAWIAGFLTSTYAGMRAAAVAAFTAITRFLSGVFRPVQAAYQAAWAWIAGLLSGAYAGIQRTAQAAWSAISGVFTSALTRIQGAFRAGVEGIGRIWRGLQEACKAPVKWVVETVYDKGIKAVWNNVGKIVGLPGLPDGPKFAGGGIIPGYRPGRDSVIAALSPGEGVLRPEAVRWLGAGWLHGMNRKARRGQLAGNRAAPPCTDCLPGFFLGGIVDGAVKKVASVFGGASRVLGPIGDWMRDGLGKVAGMALTPVKNWIKGNMKSPLWTQAMGGLSVKLIDGVIDMIRKKEDETPGGTGDGRAAFEVAKRFLGVPYVWGGTSPSGFDCSGLTQYAWKHAGVNIPRVSQDQQKFGQLISKGSEGTGDLAFFGGSMQGGGAGHVGMVSDRKGQMIHAPQTGSVIRYDGFAWPNYAGARRPGSSGGGGGAGGAGGAARWSSVVRDVLSRLGEPLSALPLVLRAISKESGGNPNAVNNTDINAQRGDPSKGLLQTIGATFRAYCAPYCDRGITDPFANIWAAIRYARARYGGGWAQRMAAPGGYDAGGLLRPGLSTVWNGTGRPEAVLTGRQWDAISRAAQSAQPGPLQVRVFIGDTELKGMIRTEVTRENGQLAATLRAVTGAAA
jgi:tape measure domain-containing protein